jgi:hypothetical protein
MEAPEQRVHTRSQYFMLRNQGESVPVFAFRAADDTLAIPALVVDIAEGGVQILTTVGARPENRAYMLEFVTGNTEDALSKRRYAVQLVWSRPDGINIKSGFAFNDEPGMSELLATHLSKAEHHLLRCVLHPVA